MRAKGPTFTVRTIWGSPLVAATSLFCIASFVLGTVIGFLIGDFNTRIDFCDDTSAPRYITNDAARAQSCAAARVQP